MQAASSDPISIFQSLIEHSIFLWIMTKDHIMGQVHDQNQEEDIREAFRVFDNVRSHDHLQNTLLCHYIRHF